MAGESVHPVPIMQFFTYEHLKEPKMREVSQKFTELAQWVKSNVPNNVERDEALRKLLEAKDCAVRAVMFR